MKFFALLALTFSGVLGQDCGLFQEGACPLSEDNIVGSDRFSETAQDCQDLCREAGHADCNFFTHFNTECYLLTSCDVVEPCEGCMSGPADPLLSDCQDTTMAPETTTAAATSNITTDSTTTAEATTVTDATTAEATTVTDAPTTVTEATTTVAETTTAEITTTVVETTQAKCDVNYGVVCDDPHNLIEHIEHISHASDCQAICQNHGECNFWSHYRQAEGHDHWGHCLIYYDCTNTVDKDCFGDEAHECQVSSHEMPDDDNEPRPGPGGKCHCTSGGNSPDLDECDDGTTDDPGFCSDDFYAGWLCDEHENLIEHIEHISQASDCQAICQNHDECHFFSHYVDEGHEHIGHCFLHWNCARFNDHECSVLVRPGCPPASPQIEDLFLELPTGVSNPKLGAPRCHCVCGPQYPDMDDCSSPELF